MKNVKIMLTTITMLSVFGGVLAFKAKRFGKVIYTTDNCTINATCPFVKQDFTMTSVNPGTAKVCVTDVRNGPCTYTWTKPEQ